MSAAVTGFRNIDVIVVSLLDVHELTQRSALPLTIITLRYGHHGATPLVLGIGMIVPYK